MTTRIITIRLPTELDERLNQKAAEMGISKSQLLRGWIETILNDNHRKIDNAINDINNRLEHIEKMITANRKD